MDTLTPGIGHNLPPNDAEILKETLADENRDLTTRAQDLLDSCQRVPAELVDDDQSSKATDLISMIAACMKSMEKKREAAKEPYLTLGRVVDGFFNGTNAKLDTAKRAVNKVQTAYLMRKAAEERRQREEDARLAREAAELKQREAEQAEAAKMPQLADTAITEAVVLTQEADKAERHAEAKPAALAVSQGSYGRKQTLTTHWIGIVQDRDKLDIKALAPYIPADAWQKALNAAVRAGVRHVEGCKISEEQTATLR